MTNKLEELREIISSGKFPKEHEYFAGARLIITDLKDQIRTKESEGVVLLRTRHAGSISWLVFQLKEIYSNKINATNKYDLYQLMGILISEQMTEDGDLIQAMLNVVSEIELKMN